MTAVRKKLDGNKTPCESLPREITTIASKIKYCSHATEWNEEMARALQEMIAVCQHRLDDLGDSYRDEYTSKLQNRRNVLAKKLMRRKR